MGACVSIREAVAWYASAGGFSVWIDRIVPLVEAFDPALATDLSERLDLAPGLSYYDLTPLSVEQFGQVYCATEQTHYELLTPGPDTGLSASGSYHISVLKTLMKTDPRTTQSVRGAKWLANYARIPVGRLILAEDRIWTAPGWAFDLVLETLAASISLEEPELFVRLSDARVLVGVGTCDLRNVPPAQLQTLVPMAVNLYTRHRDGAVREFRDAALQSELAEDICLLKEIWGFEIPQE